MNALNADNDQPEPQYEAALAALEAEQAAWFARPCVERQQYAGHFVAVRGGQVVDHDPSQRALYLRVHARFGREPVLIVNADWDAEPMFNLAVSRLWGEENRAVAEYSSV
ncbi:MAG: hypothetical protein NZ528_08380 [Caldilineales bacterium]|nr:hypothetical protein [Caldilineales bacterium]